MRKEAKTSLTDELLTWFKTKRGIDKDTLVRFGVQQEGQDVVVFSYANGEKRRSGFFGGDRRFWFTKGVIPSLYSAPGDSPIGKTVILCEGETDTMRTWQELDTAGAKNTVVMGLSGIETWRTSFATDLKDAKAVYLILDNDEDYMVQGRVEAAARTIRGDLGKKCRRIKLPSAVKDLCEFWDMFDVDTLKLMMQKGKQGSRYKPLDLSIKPPPPTWLWQGLIARGDVHLLSGPSGIGKSWLTMALAVAVADEHETFLGKEMLNAGPVLFVDEENPEDVVYDRLLKLGLKNKNRIRYIWNNGVRLDRNPDDLLDECLDYEPALVVLDSLTRIHSQEENSAGQMAPLLNDSIKPLARETGAAVVLIHHHTRAGTGPRGSSDIVASVDAAVDVHPVEDAEDTFKLRLTKSRRTARGEGITVMIRDQDDGTVRLETPYENVNVNL